MRFWLAVGAVLVGISVSGMAQQNNTFRVKHSPPDKAARKTVAPVGKSASVGTSAAANSKDLQALEHQTAKSSAPRSAAKRTSRAAAVKPVKDKPNPPINLGGGGGGNAGLARQGANPYKGRLKQKYGRQ